MDVDLKYKYFVDLDYNYNYNDEEEGLYFDIYGESSKDKINIVINDLKYANRGVYNRLRYLEKEKNYEELFVWYEIWGDLYLAIQLLLMMAGEGLTDNAKLSLNCYKKSRENLLMFSEQQTFYDGIYGMPYQINFFDNLLKKNGFHGYDRRSVHKMEFIERNILHKGSQDYFEYRDFSKLDFLPSKEKLEKKLRDLLEEYPFLGVNTNFKEWKTAIEYFHGLLLYNYKQRYLNTYVNKWEREGDMQKWLQREIDRHLIISQNEPSFTSGREIKMGGGNCDHYYKNIPICDKWKRDSNASSYPIKISEFISKLYDHNKAQFHSYAQEVKLGIVVVVDSRSVTRENKSPDIADNCYRFSVNKVSEDAAICLVIFVLQISDIPPSERK